MLSFLKKFVPKLFVSIILKENENSLKAARYFNGRFTKIVRKNYEDPKKLFAYLQQIEKKYLNYRISLFLDSEEQWLVPSLNTSDFENFITTKVSVKSIVLNNARLYTATEHIDYFEGFFEDKGGLDFLFSPLALLYYCVQKEKLENDKIALCVYKHANNLALMACKGKDILIGEFKIFERGVGLELDGFDKTNEEIISDDDEPIQLEQETQEQIQSEEQMNEEQPNEEEATQEVGESQESEEQLGEEQNEQTESENLSEELSNEFGNEFDLDKEEIGFDDVDSFSNDMEICNYIIASIQKFYNDTRYAGDFIDKLLIFTNEDINQSALEFLEDEIFLTPQIKSLNTLDLMMELMQEEVK